MKNKTLAAQSVAIISSVAPVAYISAVHSNLLESIIAYIIVFGLSSIVFKKWYMVLNVATFLVVLAFVFIIGGTL